MARGNGMAWLAITIIIVGAGCGGLSTAQDPDGSIFDAESSISDTDLVNPDSESPDLDADNIVCNSDGAVDIELSPNLELCGYSHWHDPGNHIPMCAPADRCCFVGWEPGVTHTTIDGFVPTLPDGSGNDYRVVFTFDFEEIGCENSCVVFRSNISDRTPEELTYISVNIRTVNYEAYEGVDRSLYDASCSEANATINPLNWGELNFDAVLSVNDGWIEADLSELFADSRNGRFQFGIAVLESNETDMGD